MGRVDAQERDGVWGSSHGYPQLSHAASFLMRENITNSASISCSPIDRVEVKISSSWHTLHAQAGSDKQPGHCASFQADPVVFLLSASFNYRAHHYSHCFEEISLLLPEVIRAYCLTSCIHLLP